MAQSGEWRQLSYEITGEGVMITGCDKQAQEVRIPETIEGLPVRSIGDYAFWHCANLKTMVIPEGVTRIGRMAFSECRGLAAVTLPASLTEVTRISFDRCPSLKVLKVSSENPRYASWKGLLLSKEGDVLHWCPEGVEGSVKIPPSVKRVDSRAFAFCRHLKSITFPDHVGYLGGWACYGCEQLEEVRLGQGITQLRPSTFARCHSLQSVKMSGRVTLLDEEVFAFCSSLEKIFLPPSVRSIREGAFRECRALQTIDLGRALEELGPWAFESCDSLGRILLPDTVRSIGVCAFLHCHSLAFASLPSTLFPVGDTDRLGVLHWRSFDGPFSRIHHHEGSRATGSPSRLYFSRYRIGELDRRLSYRFLGLAPDETWRFLAEISNPYEQDFIFVYHSEGLASKARYQVMEYVPKRP